MPKKSSVGSVVLGRGRKQCPSCGKIIAARATQCPHCGHQFLRQKRGRVHRGAVPTFHRPSPAARPVPSPEAEDKVIEFANQHGGVKSAMQLVDDVLQLKAQSGLEVEMIQAELQRLDKILTNIQH